MKNQQTEVLQALIKGATLTSMKCFPKGITRLSSIINRLRREGWNISTTMKNPKKKGKAPYAEYKLGRS